MFFVVVSVPHLIPLGFVLCLGEIAAVDSEAVLGQLFTRFPAELFNETFLAFEFIQFCLLNIKVLQDKVPIYRQSFPNLLKVIFLFHQLLICIFIGDVLLLSYPFGFKFLAWNSPGLISEFIELLPSLLAPETAIELLHSLLDLPCLAATLDLQHRLDQLYSKSKLQVDDDEH